MKNKLNTRALLLAAAFTILLAVVCPQVFIIATIGISAAVILLDSKPYALGAESRIAQLASSPLLTNYAITASQNAIRAVGQFIAPLCSVPGLTFRYKKYTDKNRYKVADTKRNVSGKVTRIGFSADDVAAILEPNALDFPIPNVEGLTNEELGFAIQEGQSILADSSALALESEIVTVAKAAALAAAGSAKVDFTDDGVDPISILDDAILTVMKASKNGAPVKILFGTTKFKQFRNNKQVKSRFIVGKGAPLGIVSPGIEDVGSLLMTAPEVQLSMMVIDTAAAGVAENIQFLLDDVVILFASNGTPNRMDPSFMKTFAPVGGFFKPGSFTTEDQRDQVLKMVWITLPSVPNSAAVLALKS